MKIPTLPFEVDEMVSGEILDGDSEDIRKKYLSREASLQIIGGLWVFLGGLIVLWNTIAVFLIAVLLPVFLKSPNAFFNIVMVFVFLMFGAFVLWVGLSLRNLRNWARITLGLLNIPLLYVYPLGTVISILHLYLLFSKKGQFVCSPPYQEVIDATLHIKYPDMFFLAKTFGGALFLILSVVIFGAVISKGGR